MNNTELELYRASGSGALATEGKEGAITEIQLKRITELENERDTGLNVNMNKVKWTDNKIKELETLVAKRDAPPQLSATAKAFVRRVWLFREKGIIHDIKSKYLDKGLYREEDAISLLSEIDNVMYVKNEERRTNEDHTGECDIYKEFPDKKVIIDTKCSYNAETFMNADITPDYEWQGRIYMELWDADEFHLCFVLVDAPEHHVQREKDLIKWKYYSGDMTDEELQQLENMLQPLYDQVDRNLVYSNNPRFTKEERVKRFVIHRDDSMMDLMREKVKLAREYYKTLTLNGKN